MSAHVMQMLDGRLQRRVSMHVRRDAAAQLSNGRVLYDALFTRTGYQTYPRADGSISVEYRPPSEVFRADSMASLGSLPAVLLHPSANFGTKFDTASYPVRGCTGEKVVEHTDHIHTAGTLCVWDDEWNAAIARDDDDPLRIAELSAGYTINPGPSGVGPDGTRFDVMHRDIIGDHMAGVPAGNAGSARVVTDSMTLATRAALADIAAARMDAKPLYFDLGRWPAREKPRMDEQPETPAPAPAPEVKPQAPAPEPEAPPAPKADAAEERRRIHDAALEIADERADVLELARVVFGRDYQHRAPLLDAQSKPVMDAAGKPRTTPKPTDAIKREIIGKIDAGRLTRVDGYTDEPKRAVALDMQLAECRAIVDARMSRAPVDALLAEIEKARTDNARGTQVELTAEQKAMADRVAVANDPAKQHIFGRTPANT